MLNVLIPQTKKDLAGYFDHTLLDCMATDNDIRRICVEAIRYNFYAVCVFPRWVSLCANILQGTGVKVVTVAGFPHGTNLTKIKEHEAITAIMNGADEIDFVADLASVLQGDLEYLKLEFKSILEVCRSMSPNKILKVIIESAALNEKQIHFVCSIAEETGVDYIKTSTGFHKAGGAKIEDVKLIAQSAPNCKIKAAGGIRTVNQVLNFIEAGVSRIGASASIQIVEEFCS